MTNLILRNRLKSGAINRSWLCREYYGDGPFSGFDKIAHSHNSIFLEKVRDGKFKKNELKRINEILKKLKRSL